MIENLQQMDSLLRTFWYLAIPASIFFLVQTAMTFIGADVSEGEEADFDGDLEGANAPFQVFAFRNLINFVLGFSWTGISFYTSISNKTILILLAFAVGVLFVYFLFMIIRQVQKSAEDNSFQFANTLHKSAEVYLTIPENKKGKGKILINVNGAFHELDAMTENNRIPSGTVVKVVRIENENILIVEAI